MLFYMWYRQNQKETALQEVLKEQVEDKKFMREERIEFIRIIREQSELLGRFNATLTKAERYPYEHLFGKLGLLRLRAERHSLWKANE